MNPVNNTTRPAFSVKAGDSRTGMQEATARQSSMDSKTKRGLIVVVRNQGRLPCYQLDPSPVE